MSSKDLYKRFLKLCEKWPLDDTKVGRDYGAVFRKQIGEQFPQGELGQVNNRRIVDSSLTSLEKIAANSYFNENPLKRSSASGMESWICRDAISNDGIREVHDQDEASLIKRVTKNLNIKFIGGEKISREKIDADSSK